MRLIRRAAAGLVLAGFVAAAPPAAWAHAGLASADPPPGATLGAAPTEIRLTYSEQPVAALSTVAVVDRSGRSLPDRTAGRGRRGSAHARGAGARH